MRLFRITGVFNRPRIALVNYSDQSRIESNAVAVLIAKLPLGKHCKSVLAYRQGSSTKSFQD